MELKRKNSRNGSESTFVPHIQLIESFLYCPLVASFSTLFTAWTADMVHNTSRSFRLAAWPDILRIRGSVIPAIIVPVTAMALFSTLICYVDIILQKDLGLPNAVIPTLSVVVGLLLVFRNSTSYDRYWEGRKLFQSMTVSIRNLARLIWIGVPSTPLSTNSNDPIPDDHIEKVRVVRLMSAFAASCKRHLRGEYGIRYPDIEPYLPPGFEPAEHTIRVDISSITRDGNTSTMTENTPLLADGILPTPHRQSTFSSLLRKSSQRPQEVCPTMSLPLEIAFRISLYISQQKRNGHIDSPQNTMLTSSLNSMIETFAGMERIVSTPLPLAYTIHLKQCVFLYSFTLPFVLVNDLGWWTILIVALVSFTLFGIEGIGAELENPFGLDISGGWHYILLYLLTLDLNLDAFCQELSEELEYIVRGGVPTRMEHVMLRGE